MNEPIRTPGIQPEDVYKWIHSDRAQFAKVFYETCTGIKNAAGQLVGFALTSSQLEKVLHAPMVKGRELARNFFNQYSKEASSEVGRFIYVGTELDVFFDLAVNIMRAPANDPRIIKP